MLKKALIFLFLAAPVVAINYDVAFSISDVDCSLEYTSVIEEALIKEGLLPPAAEATSQLELDGQTFTSSSQYAIDETGEVSFSSPRSDARGENSDSQSGAGNGGHRQLSLIQICINCMLYTKPSVIYCYIYQSICAEYGYQYIRRDREELGPDFSSPYPMYWNDGATESELKQAAASAQAYVQSKMVGDCAEEVVVILAELM